MQQQGPALGASSWGCAARREGAVALTTTYGPRAPSCPRPARLLPRYLALVDQGRRQRPMPATWERGPACAAPALPLPLAQSFTLNDRVVTEASGAPAASPHASTVLRGCDRSQDFRRDGPTGVPGVPGRSMQVSAVRPTRDGFGGYVPAGCRGERRRLRPVVMATAPGSVAGARMCRCLPTPWTACIDGDWPPSDSRRPACGTGRTWYGCSDACRLRTRRWLHGPSVCE